MWYDKAWEQELTVISVAKSVETQHELLPIRSGLPCSSKTYIDLIHFAFSFIHLALIRGYDLHYNSCCGEQKWQKKNDSS